MRVTGRVALGVAALMASSATTALAQDSNYWSTAYGTRAQLLGGVVTGSPGDISSVYYNPGALALAPNAEFLLAGYAVQYMRVSVANGSGPKRDLVSSFIATVPSLIAGELPILKHDRLAYSYLTRQQVDLDIEKRVTTGAQAESPLPNATFAAFELQYHQHVDESWYGLTWAHKLSEKLGFGLTPSFVYRSQRTTASLLAMGENASGQQAVLQYGRDFEYTNYRVLARLGLNGARDSLTYGITLNTPGLGLFGGGAYRQSVTLTDQTGSVGNVIGASYQEDLKSHYRSPLGVAGGASFGRGRLRLHAAAEWWAKVDRYTVLEGQPFVIHVTAPPAATHDSTVTTVVSEELDEVFNFGVGLEHHFSPDVSGYLSYHTDRSARPPDSPPDASITAWDLNHVTAGVTFNAWRSNFAVGVTTAFGNRPIPGIGSRPDRIPPQDLDSHALIVTGTLGWKFTF